MPGPCLSAYTNTEKQFFKTLAALLDLNSHCVEEISHHKAFIRDSGKKDTFLLKTYQGLLSWLYPDNDTFFIGNISSVATL